jgi:hypothetical protein
MKISVREKAAADLDALFEWIAQDNPLAPNRHGRADRQTH